MLGTQGLWAGRDLYRATPAVTRCLGFSGLIRMTAPFSRLLRHARGCWGPILTRIPTGTNAINLGLDPSVTMINRCNTFLLAALNFNFWTYLNEYNGDVYTTLQWWIQDLLKEGTRSFEKGACYTSLARCLGWNLSEGPGGEVPGSSWVF